MGCWQFAGCRIRSEHYDLHATALYRAVYRQRDAHVRGGRQRDDDRRGHYGRGKRHRGIRLYSRCKAEAVSPIRGPDTSLSWAISAARGECPLQTAPFGSDLGRFRLAGNEEGQRNLPSYGEAEVSGTLLTDVIDFTGFFPTNLTALCRIRQAHAEFRAVWSRLLSSKRTTAPIRSSCSTAVRSGPARTHRISLSAEACWRWSSPMTRMLSSTTERP